jgi:hypothetical protein
VASGRVSKEGKMAGGGEDEKMEGKVVRRRLKDVIQRRKTFSQD